MGVCSAAEGKSDKIPNLDYCYCSKSLPLAKIDYYRTDFEKEFYYYCNLFRFDPKMIEPYLRHFVESPNFVPPKNPNLELVYQKIKQAKRCRPMRLDREAGRACYVNLTKRENEDH